MCKLNGFLIMLILIKYGAFEVLEAPCGDEVWHRK
jgi:hypothetical protein